MVALADTVAAALAALDTFAAGFSGFAAGFGDGFSAGFGEGFSAPFGDDFGEGFAAGMGDGFSAGLGEDTTGVCGTALALTAALATTAAGAFAGAFADVLAGALAAGVVFGLDLGAGTAAAAVAEFFCGVADGAVLVLDDVWVTFATFTAGGGGDGVRGLAATRGLAVVADALPDARVDETTARPERVAAAWAGSEGTACCLCGFRSAPEPDLDVDGELAMAPLLPLKGAGQ